MYCTGAKPVDAVSETTQLGHHSNVYGIIRERISKHSHFQLARIYYHVARHYTNYFTTDIDNATGHNLRMPPTSHLTDLMQYFHLRFQQCWAK